MINKVRMALDIQITGLIGDSKFKIWKLPLFFFIFYQHLIPIVLTKCRLFKTELLQLYKEDLLDLFIPPIKRDKEQVTIRDDVNGGIKVISVLFYLALMNANLDRNAD